MGHKNVTRTIGRTCSLQDCSEGRASMAGWEPAASIFSPFLLIPDHILTTASRSQEAFTRPLSPSTAHPVGPPEYKPFISLLINANRKASCSPPPFQIPTLTELFSSYKQAKQNHLLLCKAGGLGAAPGLQSLDSISLPVRAGLWEEAEVGELSFPHV